MTCFGKTGKRSHESQFKKQPRYCDGRDITAACIATLWRYSGSCRVPRWLWPAVAAACGLTGQSPLQHALRLFAAFSGVLERYGGIFPETEQLAFAVKTLGYSPEFASVGGDEEKQTAAVKILAGFTSGFRLRMWVSVRGMGTPWLSLDEVIPTWIKIFLIPRGYSCRHQKCRTTFLPTDIPIKCLDASGRGWTLGNHTGRKKQRMPRSFRPWHSSSYLNLASQRGFEPLSTA